VTEKKIDENGEISYGCMNGCSVIGLVGLLLAALVGLLTREARRG